MNFLTYTILPGKGWGYLENFRENVSFSYPNIKWQTTLPYDNLFLMKQRYGDKYNPLYTIAEIEGRNTLNEKK